MDRARGWLVAIAVAGLLWALLEFALEPAAAWLWERPTVGPLLAVALYGSFFAALWWASWRVSSKLVARRREALGREHHTNHH